MSDVFLTQQFSQKILVRAKKLDFLDTGKFDSYIFKMAAVGGRRNRDVNDVMKERNFRQVESLRQLNEREQKRLSSSTDHINKRCRYELMQVTSQHSS